MSECSHNCSSCSQNCSERKESLKEPLNAHSTVKKLYAIVSGKGGVGKSLVTSLLSMSSQRNNLKTAILDADITGPSIPTAFGIKEKALGTDEGITPAVSSKGTKIMSLNLLLENETDPVVWRGPVIAGAVKQFWTDVNWGDIDAMYVDMPPGTGDVPLTVFQSLPIDGIVIVTSPQDLVSMIVEKAVNMAKMMNIPVLGIVENMAYFQCPSCSEKHSIYGKSNLEEIAAKYGIQKLARIPIESALAAACDAGKIEDYQAPWLADVANIIE